MALPRPSCLRCALGRSSLRKAGQQGRSKTFRDFGRRTYASGHQTKKSSDLPWIIGSVAVTVPAATWLLGQAPQKSDHGHHDTDESHDKEEEGGKEEKEKPAEEETKDEGEEKPAEGEPKEESKEEDKSDDSSSEDDGKDTPQTSDDEQEYEPPGPNAPGQINKNPRKGPGELQKGDRKATEKKGEKDAAKSYSGANNPRMGEQGKSYKAEGQLDSAKIHGTVDPKRNSSKE